MDGEEDEDDDRKGKESGGRGRDSAKGKAMAKVARLRREGEGGRLKVCVLPARPSLCCKDSSTSVRTNGKCG